MLLEVNNLSVSYPEFTLHPVSFALDAGEMLTIVGESGSGKTTLARAIACLSEPEAQVSGQVYLNGRELLAMDERARRPLRMKEFALSFQNSAEWLNPSLTLAEHLREVLCRAYRGAAMAARMEELMALVGLETADLERYPRELSGGMVQKFLLANALALMAPPAGGGAGAVHAAAAPAGGRAGGTTEEGQAVLLEVNNLSVSYPEFTLHPVSFALDAGEMLTIVGESGSGKTTLARAIACLSEPEAQVSGQVYLNGRELLAMDERARRPLRMKEFALSFQNSAEWLNPSLTLAEHLREVLCRAYRGAAMAARMEELMALVGLETADLERYPRELSGGMVQKFLLANALALNPALVLLDEPTGALDIASSRGITALIQELNRRLGTAFLVITHDMKLAADLGGRTVVLYDGHVEEAGDTRALLDHPRHPYTRGLLQSAVGLNPVRDMWGIRPTTVSYTRQPHGCPFYGRCTQSLPACAGHAPELTAQPDGRLLACNRGGVLTLLECRGLCKAFGRQRVLDGIDLTLYSGEIVSLVGRSGAGKTTLARTLAGLLPLEGGGSVEFQGEAADFAALHRRLGGVQMVLQDSQAALNPRMTVREAVEEPMRLSGCFQDGAAERALEDVGLFACDSFLTRHIHALSGGQRQRVAIARALTMEPALLIADEPTSMLDPSGKANLLRMLKGLQNSRGFSMLFITHDLDSALKISDRLFRLEGGTLARLNPNDYIQVRFDGLFDAG